MIIHHAVGPLGVDRLATLDHAAPRTVVRVPRYPYGASRYFLGDDFVSARGEKAAKSVAKECVIVGDQDAHVAIVCATRRPLRRMECRM